MALNPSIILQGRAPDVFGSMARGAATARGINQAQRENAFNNMLRQHGQGIMAGDQNALAQYAQFAPEKALGVQATRQSMAQREQAMQIAREESRRQGVLMGMKMDEAQRTRALEKTKQIVSMLASVQTPEQFEAIKAQISAETGQDLSQYTFDNIGPYVSKFLGFGEGLKFAEVRNGGKQSAAEQEIGRLTSIGVPYDVAVKLNSGAYKTVTDPTTRDTIVVDITTNRPVFNMTQALEGGAQPDAQPQEQAPENETRNLSFGEGYSNSPASFGLEGGAKRIANTLSGAVGADPLYPDVEATQADFSTMRESLLQTISSGYNRQPPSWLMKEIRANIPETASVFEGAGRAQAKLEALGRSFERELASIDRQLSHRLSPTDRAKLRAQKSALETARDMVGEALGSFQPETTAEDDALIKKYLD